MMSLRFSITSAFLAIFLLAGCDDILGVKSDVTREEIFDAGRTEPGLIKEVEYVPLFPFYTTSGDGAALQSPRDVYVGYDELLYVVDERGLHIIDVAGRPADFIPVTGATSVIQDRRFHLYVTARRDTVLNGRTWNLPVVLHYANLSTGNPHLVDIIWHPFDEDSRKFNRPDPMPTDEEVEFTGVAVLPDNSIYISRRGPVNNLASVLLPHNTILEFSPEGINTNAIIALNPTLPSVRSAVNPSDVMTFVHPPQRLNFPAEKHFMIAQSPSANRERLQFATLAIQAVVTTDGIVYRPNTEMIGVSGDPERGDGFLYEENKFKNPSDLAFAADGTNYIFVTDTGTDSLYAFTSRGVEGVAPPPGATSTKPVIVSFGGEGDGALQFKDPNGVAYFNRIVYVADTGNNRISRFRLNTDFE